MTTCWRSRPLSERVYRQVFREVAEAHNVSLELLLNRGGPYGTGKIRAIGWLKLRDLDYSWDQIAQHSGRLASTLQITISRYKKEKQNELG